VSPVASPHPLRHLRALAATWRGRFIFAFVALQLALPLHYYTLNRDPHDERFAWRMFSPMRMTRCKLAVQIDGTPLSLGTTFHEAWLEMAERGRQVVIDAMASKLCAERAGARVAVTMSCSYLDRPPHSVVTEDACRD
jgi:hypothetical protein